MTRHRLPDGSMLSLPPIERLVIRLRLSASTRFHLRHEPVLHGLLCQIFGHALPEVMPAAVESGRVRFAAGDDYVFGLTVVGEAIDALPAALERLEVVSRQPRPAASERTLWGNFAVAEVQRLGAPELADVEATARALAERGVATLQFLSPLELRRPRPRGARQRPKGHFDSTYFPAGAFLARCWRRFADLRAGRPSPGAVPAMPAAVRADPAALLWLDVPTRGRPGGKPGRPRGQLKGGLVGTLELAGLTPDWCALLALLQHLHVGQSVRYGFGRFRLAGSPDGEGPWRPARTYLQEVARPAALATALEHVATQSSAAGVDHQSPQSLADLGPPALASLAGSLLDGCYRAQPLAGCAIPKPSGGWRPLAVPTAADRVLQRAAAQALLPAIDSMLEDESFAYRRGFSRQGAARAIQRAWEDGYRYVLDADIEAFFDTVEWDRLFAVLDALFPFEPLVRVIRHWITVPVYFDGRRIGRSRGLPQGAPISPLLANLFLDRFDEAILGEGFRLVRFADDFVVLTKDLAAAERAHQVARRALGELGLALHEGKTSVRSMADGFGYLGYLFCRSLVIDEAKHDGGRRQEEVPPPAMSWLAAVPFERLRRLGRPSSGAEGGPPPLEDIDLGPAREAFPAKRPLYLGDHETSMRVEKETLVLEHPSRPRERLPLAGILHLTILGHGRATLTAVERLAIGGVPTYMCDARGRIRAGVAAPAADWRIWQAQAVLLADDRRALAVARVIVAGKLRNQASQLARLGLGRGVTGPIRSLARSALEADDTGTLRGLEGRAARLYFAGFAEVLPAGFEFSGRRRRPPTDPVNSLLSFGYHLLFQHAATALVSAGLNPHLGIYHQRSDRYPSLASDIQEEFRWLVDGLALALLRRREARQEDFELQPGGAVWMSRDLRKRYLTAFERRLLDTFTPRGSEEAVSYRGFLFEQAVALREIALGRLDSYRPLVRPA